MARVTRRQERGAAAWWRGFGVGLGSGVLLCVALYFLAGPGADPAGEAAVTAQRSEAAKADQTGRAPAPRFEFFTILPELEVPVPEEQVAGAGAPVQPIAPGIRVLSGTPAPQPPARDPAVPQPAPAQPPARAAVPPPPRGAPEADLPPASNARYVLQAGSFRSAADAERVKARLALQGVRADVQAVTVNGATWHRVRAGPFGSLEELGGVREQLQDAGLPTLVVRLREGA